VRWLVFNYAEIYFSVAQCRFLTPNDFVGLGEAQARLLAFQNHHQQIAAPFQENFTKSNLELLRKRFRELGLVVADGSRVSWRMSSPW